MVEYAVRGRVFRLWTDQGVFSKAKVDFGTDFLLQSVPPLSGRVLDLGCGYGTIGIVLACLNPRIECWLADINERAVALCKRNCGLNLPPSQPGAPRPEARVVQSDGFSRVEGIFDAIVTNPPIRAGKSNLFRLYRECLPRLSGGGALYTVIRKQQGMESSRAELLRIFGNCAVIARKSGYRVLRSIRTFD
jgi:16S rRNA (guanine1207-N2)-methyltransferase